MPDAQPRAVANIASRGDPLDVWQRDALGGDAAQLRLPLRDKVDLRRLAEILRHAANRLEVLSSRRDLDDFHALLMARSEVRAAQAKASSRMTTRKTRGDAVG